ncbi:MAG: FecR domain-containing protein [Neptuniibacter sp.]
MKRNSLLVIILAFGFLAGGVQAQTKAGAVVLSIGKNFAQQPEQQPRKLKRKSEIYDADRITTGMKGQVQLRFTDGSRLSIRPETEFIIEAYEFPGGQPEKGKAVYKLIKGGLRTITGAISKADTKNYAVKTPIATIGVRGTHYSLFFCDRACKESTQTQSGLYGYVLEGEIVVSVDSEVSPVSAKHYFHLNMDGALTITQSPFGVFEGLKDLEGGQVLPTEIGQDIPALDVNTGPEVNNITLPASPNTPAPPRVPSPPKGGTYP